jgi:hypothetical protein
LFGHGFQANSNLHAPAQGKATTLPMALPQRKKGPFTMGTEPTTNFDVEALNALGARLFRWRRQRRRSRDGAGHLLVARL